MTTRKDSCGSEEKEREAYEIFVQHDKIVDAKGNLVDTNGSVSVLPNGEPFKTEKAIFDMLHELTMRNYFTIDNIKENIKFKSNY